MVEVASVGGVSSRWYIRFGDSRLVEGIGTDGARILGLRSHGNDHVVAVAARVELVRKAVQDLVVKHGCARGGSDKG